MSEKKKITIETRKAELVVRKAEPADAEIIAELSIQLDHKLTQAEAKERIEKISRDDDQEIFVVEDIGFKVLGFINVTAHYEMLSGVQGRLGGLVVDENARGIGLGRTLMDAAEKWVKDKGTETMKVNSNVVRIDSHKFYEKMGYEKYKEQAVFKKKLN